MKDNDATALNLSFCGIKGFYRDVIFSRSKQPQWDSGWKSNIIVHDCNLLLAMLMKGQEGINGILYWAVGKGEENWDHKSLAPLANTSQLTAEVSRKAVAPQDIVFLDESGEPSDEPTPCIEVTSAFSGEDFANDDSKILREFGLFGGNATDQPDSGVMIDYVIHPPIDMTGGITLTRKLRLMFALGDVFHTVPEQIPGPDLSGFGANLPVIDIAGVGKKFSKILNDQGIHKLSDLIAIDPLMPAGSIPMARLRQLYGKARMVMKLNINLEPFAVFSGFSISRLLLGRPEELANAFADAGITSEDVLNLQKDLTILQVALDESYLKKITLGDLMINHIR
jgi:hypothetical protein